MTITALLQPACRYISDVLETGTSAERIVARTIMHLLPLGAIDSGKIVPMDRSDEMQTIEQAWEFWRPIICNEDGSINLEQLKLELCDAANFMGFAASVYDYATGGQCTKVNTLPSVVKALIDDHITELCEEYQAPAPAPLAVPFGMVLVPREPTEDMLSNVDEEVGGHCHSCSKWSASWDDCRRVWAAMVAAAPAVAPLTLETAAEARKDREHAEAYYRQAEKLLTANEQTLHAEVQRLTAELAASQCAAVAHATEYDQVLSEMDGAGCPRCLGSGSVPAMSNGGPDAHEIDVDCYHCGGSGSARDAYLKLAEFYSKATSELTQLRYYRWFNEQEKTKQADKLEAAQQHAYAEGRKDEAESREPGAEDYASGFRDGWIDCRRTMAGFVEPDSAVIAMSIRGNWKPSLGPDPDRPELSQPLAVGAKLPAGLRRAAERTREDLGPNGTNYPDIRALLAFAEAAIEAASYPPVQPKEPTHD